MAKVEYIFIYVYVYIINIYLFIHFFSDEINASLHLAKKVNVINLF